MGVVLETEVVEEMCAALENGSAAGGRRAAVGGRDRVFNRHPKKPLLQRRQINISSRHQVIK